VGADDVTRNHRSARKVLMRINSGVLTCSAGKELM